MTRGWRFFIDRGGTFTDVVALAPSGELHVRKVLSDDGRHGADAAVAAIRILAGAEPVLSVRLGTTVATNALLERKGERVCLAITEGFGDALLIGTQQRPELFSLEIRRPAPLFERVVEVGERVLADGSVRRPLEAEATRSALRAAHLAGCRSLAVVLVHGFAHDAHESAVEQLGREAGFEHVSVSHEVAPEPGLVARGDTTCVDAYLTPVLARHVERLREELGAGPSLRFMTSAGGLVRAESFRGKDALLSGPAGGAVAVAAVARLAGLDAALGFDMGGTSTDVCRWSAREGFDRVLEREVAGVRVRAPMLDIVTVAAGGGSVLASTGRRFTAGPESAGASPGPAAYRAGGPPTVTDANIVLGRVQPAFFPRCFGADGDEPLDAGASRAALAPLAAGAGLTVEEVAAGLVRIANESMAAAIREVSVARGRDPRAHALVPFGGAGGQHACALAVLLGIRKVVLHPLAGVLSAWGLSLADVRREQSEAVLRPLDNAALADVLPRVSALAESLARAVENEEGIPVERVRVERFLDLRHAGADLVLTVPLPPGTADAASLRAAFDRRHGELCGFVRPELPVEIVSLRAEAAGEVAEHADAAVAPADAPALPVARVTTWFDVVDAKGLRRAVPRDTPVFRREHLRAGHVLDGPALVAEPAATTVLDPGWRCTVDAHGLLVLEHVAEPAREVVPTERDPVRLEIFANRFMSIAEQMGQVLRRVSHSPNMKERLDYSCAIFTADGRLVANAPHVPVHLGAMGETVRALLAERGAAGFRPGLVVASNDPFRGGSHLPDVTVVTPVFAEGRLALFTACRGHHADIGGPVPGSMPPDSRTLAEEGLLLHDVVLVEDGRFREAEVRALLEAGPHPVRDPGERIADLQAQAAANALGAARLAELIDELGLPVVQAYLGHALDDAAEATRELLSRLPSGTHRFEDELDEGSRIAVAITIGGGGALFDFTGTSPVQPGNLNAPRAITIAAVLYVLRCLVGRTIPLNAGTLEPVRIHVPEGTLLSPAPPAAVAGGNVETSMRIADVLLGALGRQAASQGTMNNVTFGDDTFGYYETIGGGAGAGPGFRGASGVHSHLTNTRITDVEVLERRHPVVVREFKLRRGSGGAGRWPGGDGIVRAIEFRVPLRAAVLSERRATRPFGMAGGGPGQPGRNVRVRANGEVTVLRGRAQVDVAAGDVLVIETPGGGGWGEP